MVLLASCSGGQNQQVEQPQPVTQQEATPVAPPPAPQSPPDPWAGIPEAPITLTSLSGQKVMVLQIGTLVSPDTAGHQALRQSAATTLDTALERANTGVDWVGVAEQRRAVRRNPTVAVNPDRLATETLLDPSVERVPPSLVISMRALAAMTGSRYALAPAALRFLPEAGGIKATWVMVLADSRTGNIMARLRASGTGATMQEALVAASARVLVSQ